MKKWFTLLLVTAMVLSCTALADIDVKTFPEKPANFAEVVDPKSPLTTLYSGAFRVPVTVEGSDTEHSVIVYLAEGYHQTQGFILIAPDSHVTAAQCLEEGGWKEVADANNLYLMVLEPSEDAYANDAYIAAATTLADSRNYWRQPEGRNYVVAYGDAADLTVKFVEGMLPSTWAGLAAFGDLTLNASDIVNDHGVELPVWLFMNEKDHENELIELFKDFNDCTDEVYANANANEIYFPNAHTTNLLLNDQPMSQVRVTITADAAALNADRAAYVYDFLKKGTREVGYDDKAMRYTHELSDWGATVESVEVGGVTRSWVQYVPTHLRETAEGKAPLLVVIHGAALNGEYYAERTEYIKLAEEFGFIIVFPTGSVGKGITPSWSASISDEGEWSNDVKFIANMVDVLKADLPIDTARMYVYGHSAGGVFTQNMIQFLDGTFAAAFGTGCAFSSIKTYDHAYDMPFALLVGDHDYTSPSDLATTQKVRDCITHHAQYNACGTVEDIDGAYRMGRYNIYAWENDHGVPMVQYFEVIDLPHTATLDGGILMFNWMSQFSRNADGTVGYRSDLYMAK